LAVRQPSGSVLLQCFLATMCVVHHENTKRWMVGCYNSLYVSCFGDFERFFFGISIYYVFTLSLHIESTDSVIHFAYKHTGVTLQ